MKDEQLYSIALTRIPGLGLIGIHKLVDALGSATAVFRNRKDAYIHKVLPLNLS